MRVYFSREIKLFVFLKYINEYKEGYIVSFFGKERVSSFEKRGCRDVWYYVYKMIY